VHSCLRFRVPFLEEKYSILRMINQAVCQAIKKKSINESKIQQYVTCISQSMDGHEQERIKLFKEGSAGSNVL
jgi:hypothetical protein